MVAVALARDSRVRALGWFRWRAVTQNAALTITATSATLWAGGFTYLAVMRHLAYGTHAEDLGFTDQVLWNFLHGQWFRMSVYNGATWNTEIDIGKLARPDSLLAFHFEPLLLALVPIYALATNPVTLLVLQSVAVAAGAIPALRIARHLTRSTWAALAVAGAYLLSPLGQWAVLSDFHTSTFAAPLLLLAVERLLVARAPFQCVAAAVAAAAAREDAAVAVAVLGASLMLAKQTRRAGLAIGAAGLAITILAALTIRTYSGGISPFEVRYGPTLTSPIAAFTRPLVAQYAITLLLSGGWLALLAPLAVLPALPSLALNALSTSPWMASGQAHYSALVLPFITLGSAFGLRQLGAHPRLQLGASGALVLSAAVAYVTAGAGPFAANYAPASMTLHAALANAFAAEIPQDAAVSASTALVPHLSERSRVYVFPSVLDASYVLLDLQATPAPTSARDVYLRVQRLLADGWMTARSDDGLLLLARSPQDLSLLNPVLVGDKTSRLSGGTSFPVGRSTVTPSLPAKPPPPRLLGAQLVPSPDGALDVDGPRWILRTTWQADQPLPTGIRPDFVIRLNTGEQIDRWDVADVWWNPPADWPLHRPVTIDVPDVPSRTFSSWTATWTTQ